MSQAAHLGFRLKRLVMLTLFAGLFWVETGFAEHNLIMGVHPYLSASEIYDRFNPLAKYLSQVLEKPVLIRVARDYREHIERIGKGDVDIAFIGPAMYVAMVDRFGPKPLLARLEVNGKPFFQGVFITRADSPIKRLEDLRGKRFAFGDKGSTMSHLLPRYELNQAGIQIRDFSDHEFLGSHNNVALGVLAGDFDAGAVKEEVFEAFKKRGLKEFARTAPISEHLFVASPNLSEEQVAQIRELLLKLNRVPGGMEVIRSIKRSMTSLVPVADEDYDQLRIYLKEVQQEISVQ